MTTGTEVGRAPWWGRLLDSIVVTPWRGPTGRGVVRTSIAAGSSFLVAFYWLSRGAPEAFVLMSGAAVITALTARSSYLRLLLADEGMDDVSWCAMPALTRRA